MAAPVILDPEVFQLPLELDSDAVCPVAGDNEGRGVLSGTVWGRESTRSLPCLLAVLYTLVHA